MEMEITFRIIWCKVISPIFSDTNKDASKQFDVSPGFNEELDAYLLMPPSFCTLLSTLSYHRSMKPSYHYLPTSTTRGTPETQRKWSTSTLPWGYPSPIWGKPCRLFPSSPVLHWWQLPWSHPDHLRRPRSPATHWEPDSPGRKWENVLGWTTHLSVHTFCCEWFQKSEFRG